ncbi:MAG TPA: FHA domain-containing protein [Candidatus Acidoferrum sp.]|nr:FHA domain-containing protein [Candidatus Acidoferrum sp.]
MARLVGKGAEHEGRVFDLHLGLNRLGRSSDNHFQVEDPTISGLHCELALSEGRLSVHDCGSTNGTYVDGERIRDADLSPGQTLRLGDVELLVETTDVVIAIPTFEVPRPAPPVVLSDGSLICPRHPKAQATHQCTHCREVLCDACVHRLRRRGGKVLKLCPICSHPCTPIGGEKKQKKSFLGMWRKTVKLPFLQSAKSKRAE